MPTEDVRFNPFPGLRPFQYGEQHLFFGREGQSEEILRRLTEHRFLAVVGTSGSGKSSLIRAGLLPDLHGGFMSGAGSHWRTAVFRPIGDPIGNLARALNTPEVLQTDPASGDDQARSNLLLEVTLRRSSLGLIDAVRLARLPKEDNLLVVVDQFEELFRFANAANTPAQADDAAAFVKLLLEATWQAETPIYIVITMRSDFIGDCARFPDLAENVTAGMYLIPRMTREQRRSAIADPVGVGGGCISIRLVNLLLNEVGDNPDQLPVLQHSLMRTWEHWVMRTPSAESYEGDPIDFVDYEAIGGLTHALSNHADEAFNALPSDRHREIAKRMFQCLTEKGADNREIRRPTSVATLGIVAGASKNEVVDVIREFHKQGRSFLTVPSEGELSDDALIDISHESLIRLWERLRGWVEEEAESARMYKRLADAAAMEAHGNGNLWDGPLLQGALDWEKEALPTAEWAQRYDPAFDQAMAFLEKSRRSQRMRRLAMASVAAVLIVSVGVVWASIHTTQLRAHVAEVERKEEKLEHELDMEKSKRAIGKMADRLRMQALREQEDRLVNAEGRISSLDQLMRETPLYQQANLHNAKASLLLDEERMGDAIAEASATIAMAPDNVSAYTARGYAQILEKDPKKALADFEQVRRINPKMCLNYLNMTIVLGQLGRIPEAQKALDSAITYAAYGDNSGGVEAKLPEEIHDTTGRTALYANGAVFRQALYFLKPLLDAYAGQTEFESDLKKAENHLQLDGVRAAEKEDAALVAITWAGFLEQMNTDNYGLSAGQGMLWEQAEYPENAERHYAAFLKTHQERKDSRYEDLAKWVREHPRKVIRATSAKDAGELEVQAEVANATTNYATAEKLVNQAIDIEPKNIRLYVLRMGILFQEGEGPYQAYRNALFKIDQYNTDISDLKEELEKEKNASKSAQAPASALEQKKESPAEKLAELEEDRKKKQATRDWEERKMRAFYKRVRDDCETVLEMQPDTPNAYLYRALATYRLQRPDEHHDAVVRDLKHTLALDPSNEGAINWLGVVMADSDPQEAAEWMEKYERLDPGSDYKLYQLAELQNKLGQFADAYDTIQRAIGINPTDYSYYQTRAEAEKGLGYSEQQIQRDRAEGDRVAEEVLRRKGSRQDLDDAGSWEEDRWNILSELAKSESEDVRCNSDMTTCVTSRVTKGLGEWALFGIDSVKEAGQDTRIVKLDHGENGGAVVGSSGEVYARYSYDEKDKRSQVKIGTAEVLSVEPGTAMVKVKMPKPEGDSLVREGDVVGLYFRTPKIDHRSPLWSVLKFNISFADSSDKTIADFDTLYSKESPELDHTLYQKMLDDIHEYGRVKGDSLNEGKPVSKGKLAAKPMKVRDVLEAATQEDLDRFFKYVVKVPRTFFGYRWRIGVFYEWWVEQGMPED